MRLTANLMVAAVVALLAAPPALAAKHALSSAQKQEIDWDGRVEIVAVSADSEAALRVKVRELAKPIDWNEFKTVAARTRRDFASTDEFRLIQVCERDKGTTEETIAPWMFVSSPRMASS